MSSGRAETQWSPRIPALDGLRGIAVLAVLVGHAGLLFGSNGILGVDVFFALSGYLICGLLCAEMARRETISLGRFWLRRAARLVPALVLVVVTIEVAGQALGRWSSADQLQSVAALGFTSNWAFAAHDVSYFDQYEAPSPVLHTWSLGVEEQFYLVMPLLVLGAWVVGRRQWRPLLAALLGLTAGLSLVTASRLADGSAPWAYYGTHTRSFELALGGLAGLLAPPRRIAALSARPRRLFEAVGLVALGLLVLRLFRGSLDANPASVGQRLTVVILTILVILGVVAGGSVWSWLLAHGPLLWLGVISYGVYLWHWPIYLWLTPDQTDLTASGLFVLRLTLTCAVATASYLLLERPARAWLRRENPLAGSAALVSSLAVVAMLVLLLPTVPRRSTDLATTGASHPTAGVWSAPRQNDAQAAQAAARSGGRPTGSRPAEQATRVFVVGDSVGMNLRQLLTPRLSRGLVVDGSTWLGCSLVPGTLVAAGQVRPPDPECAAWSRSWPAAAAAFDPDIVLLMPGVGEQFDRRVGTQVLPGGSPEHEQYLAARLGRLIDDLRAHDLRVAMTTIPCHGAPDFGLSVDPQIINSSERITEANAAVRSAARASGADVLDLNTFLCPHGYDNVRDGVQLRVDGIHFTQQGAGIVWRWLNPRLRVTAAAPALAPPVSPGTTGSSAGALRPPG